MPTLVKIIEEQQFLSDRISTQVRLICCSIMGVIWGFFISDVAIIKLLIQGYSRTFIFLILLSIVILFVDYLQYQFGYFNAGQLLNKLVKNKLNEGNYDSGSLSYKIRNYCFYFKQILLFCEIFIFTSVLIFFFLDYGIGH